MLKNLGFIYFLAPFIASPSVIKNRFSLILSIILGRSKYTIKLKDNAIFHFQKTEFNTMLSLIGTLAYAASYTITPNKTLEISFDLKNKFEIPLQNMSDEDKNLLDIFFMATRAGANFVTDSDADIGDYRDKTFRIIKKGDKKIIETSNGIKFYIDSIHPGNTIVECFVNNLHLINSNDDWNGKIIIDVGAECGDTPLYYASQGAVVYAFEPIKENFDAMLRNISLNPDISDKIIPINAAIGKDEILKFYQAPESPTIGSSFVYNKRGKNAIVVEAQGYSLQSALQKFKIDHVDLLKMDCKGCEFYLTENDLKVVNRVKIEYIARYSSHKLEDLENLFEKTGFEYMIYRMNPFDRQSNKFAGHIYAKKIDTLTI